MKHQPAKSFQRIQDDFVRILTAPGELSTEDAELIFKQISDKYADPMRHYHNWAHIMNLWEQAGDLQWGFENPDAVKMAIILHDVIFHFGKQNKSNEEFSAMLAEDILNQAGHGSEFTKRVADLIRMTEKHETFNDGDHDAELFLDMDMMSFAEPDNVFLQNAANVAKEIIQTSGVEKCREGMLGFMKHLATKNRFFLSDIYQDKHGERAMKNIKWEIENFDTIIGLATSPQGSNPWSPPGKVLN